MTRPDSFRQRAVRRARARRPTFLVTVAMMAGTFVLACSEEERQVVRSEPCAELMDEMAMAREIDEQIDLLDTALVVCRSADAFAAAMERHEGAVAVEPMEFVTNRCDQPPTARVGGSRICREVAPPTTTTTVPDQAAVLTYAGRTLDGRDVEITSAQTMFTEGRPATIVQIVDIGTEDGCEGVQREYDRWIPFVTSPDIGDEASVYAQHAINVLGRLGCDIPNPPTQPETIASD